MTYRLAKEALWKCSENKATVNRTAGYTHDGKKKPQLVKNATGEYKLTACHAQGCFSIWYNEDIMSFFTKGSQAMTD